MPLIKRRAAASEEAKQDEQQQLDLDVQPTSYESPAPVEVPQSENENPETEKKVVVRRRRVVKSENTENTEAPQTEAPAVTEQAPAEGTAPVETDLQKIITKAAPVPRDSTETIDTATITALEATTAVTTTARIMQNAMQCGTQKYRPHRLLKIPKNMNQNPVSR